MTGPALFALPPGADFAAEFARGYHERFGDLPLALRARATVLVNTARAAEEISAALADLAPNPGILPDVRLIAALGDDPDLSRNLPEAVPPLRRSLHITRLVEQFLALRRADDAPHAPTSAAADLAEALIFLIDQFHDHGIAFDRLHQIEVAGDAARHWQESLQFFDIVLTHWPKIRDEEENARLDPRDRHGRLIDAQIARWAKAPPDAPVIAAASTGSVGTTARLLTAIARLPRGAVVLPGLDTATDPGIWETAGADHPLGPFRGLLSALDMTPADALPWRVISATARQSLLAQTMRPAPVTDHWHEAANVLKAEAPAALNGLSLIKAEGPRQEATAIAVAIREALEDGDAHIAVITSDGALARRVTAALGRFGIVPDDTMGAPLSQSVPGTLLALTLAAAGPGAGPLATAALLQHPLVRPGVPRGIHLGLARDYERQILRKRGSDGANLPPDPDAEPEEEAWRTRVANALSPVARALATNAPLGPQAAALQGALAALTDPGTGPASEPGAAADPEIAQNTPAIWEGEGGPELRAFLDDLARQADAAGGGKITDFPALLTGLMRGIQLRPRLRESHRRVRISGTREARIEGADRVILAGLNDGIWPAAADPGPWLSRPMHETIGLPMPERAVGLSAHDFLQAACRPNVILTRSARSEGSPTVASRWLVRLETLLTGIGADVEWGAVQERGDRYLRIAAALDRPARTARRAERPRPAPPASAIPRLLPVTQIETLIRDAYAVYARYVLRLRALDPLGRRADMRERGQVLHRVLERFVEETIPWPGPQAARTRLMEAADIVLALEPVPPDLRRAWRGRIGRFADWLIEQEAARRTFADPLAWECRGQTVLPVAGGDFTVIAQADRIDRLSDGTAAIYDYKSGHPPGDKQIKLRFNQQLHMAALILAADGFPDVPPLQASTGAYIGLTGGRRGGDERQCPGLAEELPAYRDQLIQLLGAYLDGAPWVSRGRPERITFESDYDHLARAAEWSGEDAQ